MYKWLVRPLLFLLSPETAHKFTFTLLKWILSIPGMKSLFKALFVYRHHSLEREVFGLKFENPVGLAAGFDKDAKMIDEFACLGFGFIEIGTLTPVGQPGNDKPRLFRLPKDQSLINRMGFNNGGVKAAVDRLKARKSKVIVGGNIGKNKITPNDEAFSDYLKCFNALFDYVDYFVVNVSSPNTPNLRELQDKKPLHDLLQGLMNDNKRREKQKPILLKIAPDLSTEQLDDIVDITKTVQLDGLIVNNTTISRDNLTTNPDRIATIGAGGLSGKALTAKSTGVIKYLRGKLGEKVPIIGVGGIFSPKDALEKIDAGATLIQVYTGLIYEGPEMVKKINQTLAQ